MELLRKMNLGIGFALAILLSGCGDNESAAPDESTSDVIDKKPAADAEANYTTSMVRTPVLSAVLPFYEELTGMKIVVSESITDADTLTAKSPRLMTREEMIEFYQTCFEDQGFEIRPVNDTTVHFARKMIDGVEVVAPKRTAPPRMVVLAPRKSLPSTKPGEVAGDRFTAHAIQTPLIEYVLPAYGELVNKKVVPDDSIADKTTMTINTMKVMSRVEAIQFYEDNFRIKGYILTAIDEETVQFSKAER